MRPTVLPGSGQEVVGFVLGAEASGSGGGGTEVKHDTRSTHYRSGREVDALHRPGFGADLGTSLDIHRSDLFSLYLESLYCPSTESDTDLSSLLCTSLLHRLGQCRHSVAMGRYRRTCAAVSGLAFFHCVAGLDGLWLASCCALAPFRSWRSLSGKLVAIKNSTNLSKEPITMRWRLA